MKRSGQRMSWDMCEPRLDEMLNDKGPEDEMVWRLSHVPPGVRYGVAPASGIRRPSKN